ncbi:MAG TPA: hypothetical protein P5075_08695 [Eubacteriales bacterium]|nr:hypothetical protein [Eubacteriales bacterium]
MKRLIARALPHLTIILSLMTLVFFSVDGFNPVMAFMASELSKRIFAVLAVCAIATSVMLIARFWREDDRRERKLARKRAAEEALAAEQAALEDTNLAKASSDDTMSE